MYNTVVRQKEGRFSVLAVIYLLIIVGLFLPSHSANAHLILADAIAHSMWPKKSLLRCPRDLLLNKAKADWLMGWESDKGGWGGCVGEGGGLNCPERFLCILNRSG